MFPKVVITKIVIKNSYVLEKFQNDNQDKVKPFENSYLVFVNLQTRDTMFRRKFFQRIVLVPVSSSI